MIKAIRRLLTLAVLSVLFFVSQAQPVNIEREKKEILPDRQATKPYKLLTNGRQITIKSTKDIKDIMLWTTGGNRVVEQKEINNSYYVLDIPVNQKTFFLMIGLSDGKIYTEKIGLRE